MTNRDAAEPDRVHSWSLSRRQALSLGAGGLAGLSGCVDAVESLGSTADPEPRPPVTDRLSASTEFTLEEATVEVAFAPDLPVVSFPGLDGTLRLYSSPNLDPDSRTLLGERAITQADRSATYAFDPDYEFGYAQRFHVTFEPADGDDAGEHEIHRTERAHIPFYNAARDTETLRVDRPFTASREEWADRDTDLYRAEIWFDEPDETPFDVPAVDESTFDPEWYQYRDLTMTVLVRFPVFDGFSPGEGAPRLEWAVFNLSMNEWELLEAFRWNSRLTQKYERNGRSAIYDVSGDDYTAMKSLMNGNGHDEVASENPTPFEAYRKVRYTDASYVLGFTNALLFAAGRPFCKRAADRIQQSLDNPSFEQVETKEYHKATLLQVFVGSSPYSLEAGSYSKSPEEAINAWYLDTQGADQAGGHCRDGTHLYCGIAAHLLNAGLCCVSMGVSGLAHETAGVIDLERPAAVSEIEDHPAPLMTWPYQLETPHGGASLVECTRKAPSVGWNFADSSDIHAFAYLFEPDVNSHVPVNDAFEPDRDGTVRAPAADPEIPWEYAADHATITDSEEL